jgi:hypothetical protein
MASTYATTSCNTNANINVDKICATDIVVERKIEYINSASQRFSKDGEFVEVNNEGIFSTINNDNNALIMLETIKNLLIKNNYFTEEEFAKEYNGIQEQIQLRIDGHLVAQKLTESPKTYY